MLELRNIRGGVIFRAEAETERELVELAVQQRVCLAWANLRGYDLRGAVLRGASLSHADLRATCLDRADLTDADLRVAISDRDCRVSLQGTNLTNADIRSAFDPSAVSFVISPETNFSGVRVCAVQSVMLHEMTQDQRRQLNKREECIELQKTLRTTPKAVPVVLDALRNGRIDGTRYYGKCCCLVGTIAKTVELAQRMRFVDRVGNPDSYIERWFMRITPGMTPSNSAVCAMTEEWIIEASK